MAFDENEILPGWETARGPHGGYVMALLVRAMEHAVGDAARQPRSLTTHFLRPPAVGPITTSATVERAGRSMTTVTARLEQNGKPVALGVGAFSGAYGGADIRGTPAPAGGAPRDTPLPHPRGATPRQPLRADPRRATGDRTARAAATLRRRALHGLREPGGGRLDRSAR